MTKRLVIVEDEELEIKPPVRVKRPEPVKVRRIELLSTVKAEVDEWDDMERAVDVE